MSSLCKQSHVTGPGELQPEMKPFSSCLYGHFTHENHSHFLLPFYSFLNQVSPRNKTNLFKTWSF